AKSGAASASRRRAVGRRSWWRRRTPRLPRHSRPPRPAPPRRIFGTRSRPSPSLRRRPTHRSRRAGAPAPARGRQHRPPAGAGRVGRARGGGGRGAVGAVRRHPFRVAAGIVAILFLWFLFALFQPFHGDGSGRVVVTIPKGAGVSEVGDLLDREGVVSSSTL